MGYNLTRIDNSTGLDSLLGNINQEANGLPGISILIILWVATFVYANNRNLNPGESFTTSSFLTSLIAGLMFFTGLTSLSVVIVTLVMFFGGVVYLAFK